MIKTLAILAAMLAGYSIASRIHGVVYAQQGEALAPKTQQPDECCPTGSVAAQRPSPAAVPRAAMADDPAPAPVACTLSGPALRERTAQIRELLNKSATRIERRSGAVDVEFAEGHIREVAEFIEMERKCCPFLSFRLDFPSGGPVRLSVAAPKEAQSILEGMFAPTETGIANP